MVITKIFSIMDSSMQKEAPPSVARALTCLILAIRRKFKGILSIDFNLLLDIFINLDKKLKRCGYQEEDLHVANIVFIFMLLKESLKSWPENGTFPILRIQIMQCLFLSYSYAGSEISYPVRPFLGDIDKNEFFDGCVKMCNDHSEKMLNVMQNTAVYDTYLRELMQKEL